MPVMSPYKQSVIDKPTRKIHNNSLNEHLNKHFYPFFNTINHRFFLQTNTPVSSALPSDTTYSINMVAPMNEIPYDSLLIATNIGINFISSKQVLARVKKSFLATINPLLAAWII